MNAKRSLLSALLISAFSFSLSASAADISANTNFVAVVFGKSVSAAEIGLSGSATAKAASKSLLDLIWHEVGDRYAKKNNLVATDPECEAFENFQSVATERNREKQQRELSKLELQLKSDNISEEKRTEVEKERKALLAGEALLGSAQNSPQEAKRQASRQWVTWHKVDKAVYEQYGGKVATTAFGLYPIEARRKLIEEYIAEGKIRFVDADFETQFWKSYEEGGRFFVERKQIDFTPYWLKPIPDDPQ